MELKRRATRRELFDADEFSSDWKSHQLYRINHIKEYRAKTLNVPAKSLRLMYRDKHFLELFSASGQHIRYRPEGVITHIHDGFNLMDMLEFTVSWVDPWGYAHTAERSFLDIQINPVTEITYMKNLRAVRAATSRHWTRKEL